MLKLKHFSAIFNLENVHVDILTDHYDNDGYWIYNATIEDVSDLMEREVKDTWVSVTGKVFNIELRKRG